MNNTNSQEFNPNAVSIYSAGDAMEDFPVLKAFQQYIDAEQAKARKRLLTMGIFFGVLMFVVIAIFVGLLASVSSRNQQLNDRLVEFAMRERNPGSAVVVQPQDNAALLSLTSKLEEMQRKLSSKEAETKAAQMEAEQKKIREAAAAATAKAEENAKATSAAELEVQRLKTLLELEKQKAAAEKERKHQEELEAYRRKHYPELYETPKPAPKKVVSPSRITPTQADIDDIIREIEAGDKKESVKQETLKPVSYFETEPQAASEKPSVRDQQPPVKKTEASAATTESHPTRSVSVPSGKTRVSWGIPD